MALGKKPYPKATVKKIIKAHSNHNIKKNADVTIFLDYVLFMETLVKEAAIQSKQSGERGLSARSVKKVTRKKASRQRDSSAPAHETTTSAQLSATASEWGSSHDEVRGQREPPSFSSIYSLSHITVDSATTPRANFLPPKTSHFVAMAAQAQAAQPTSKSAKKKAAKALERTESPAPSVASASVDKNGDDESPYIKEIQNHERNIRNVNKKI
ncbi:hypothetical protein FGRMN_8859, partial [Fusarium graminum]